MPISLVESKHCLCCRVSVTQELSEASACWCLIGKHKNKRRKQGLIWHLQNQPHFFFLRGNYAKTYECSVSQISYFLHTAYCTGWIIYWHWLGIIPERILLKSTVIRKLLIKLQSLLTPKYWLPKIRTWSNAILKYLIVLLNHPINQDWCGLSFQKEKKYFYKFTFTLTIEDKWRWHYMFILLLFLYEGSKRKIFGVAKGS